MQRCTNLQICSIMDALSLYGWVALKRYLLRHLPGCPQEKRSCSCVRLGGESSTYCALEFADICGIVIRERGTRLILLIHATLLLITCANAFGDHEAMCDIDAFACATGVKNATWSLSLFGPGRHLNGLSRWQRGALRKCGL